jgi:cyclic dehypoxanthinyl futalosine synthase
MDQSIESLANKIKQNQRLSREDASYLFECASMADLANLATLRKSNFQDPNQATYLIMAIINYTNVCVAKCDYCSFYRLPHDKESYLLSQEQVFQKIDQLIEHGGSLIGFNGGFHPKLRVKDYADLFSAIHHRYPQLTFFEMTIAEFMFACKVSKLSYKEGAKVLKDAGTKWITGGGAEVLDNNFRKRHSPGKYTVEDYFSAQRSVLDEGMGSTATMVIGFDESMEERFNHLEALREFQDSLDTPLTSFLCWTYKPWNNELGGQEIPTTEYLRWLAISRIYLDNFPHIRTSVLTKNEEALLGLQYGANDFDLPTEDEVTQKAGATISHEFESILNFGRKLGYTLIHRKPFERTQLSVPTLVQVDITNPGCEV